MIGFHDFLGLLAVLAFVAAFTYTGILAWRGRTRK